MPTDFKGIAVALLTIISLVGLLAFCVAGCSSGPPKPKTHTSVPSLDVAQERVKQLRSSIEDAKDGVSRLKARHELIDYKESLVK